MNAWFKGLIIAGVTVAGLAIAVSAAWAIDDRIAHGDTVGRNVTVGGEEIGGLGAGDLAAVLDGLAAATADQELTVTAPDGVFTATNANTGVSLDIDVVAAAAFDAGRDEGMWGNLTSWVTSFFDPREVADVYALDEARLAEWVDSHPDGVHLQPVEPSLSGSSGELVATPGVDGAYLEPGTVVPTVAAEVQAGRVPVAIEVEWTPLPPRVDQAALDDAIADAEGLIAYPLTVEVDTEVVSIGDKAITRWIEADQADDRLSVRLVRARILETLQRVLDDIVTEGTPPEFTIVDGEVDVVYGTPPMKCCADEAGDVVVEAIRSGHEGAVALPLVQIEDEESQAAKLGIEEIVGEFTTNHACCEGRVDNIQRIADIVRGVVILPGDQFSINEFVGRRTAEKGFVAAGTIQQGRFVDGVGGGISQFATTMFNAAFFAGLDFETYQSHSIYISRYPYGREATLSYPLPDLVVVNNTPFGMLIWTEYTSTSITVQLWSTPYFEVEQTGQSSYGIGQCTRVETFRERTDPDGEVLEDMVFATYRPGEGLDCNGDPTPELD